MESVICGYSAGETTDPDYDQICTGESGHAEVVQITFDNTVISFNQLLEVFFSTHNPTTLNRQGVDVGTQYRSIILCHSDQQQQIAQQLMDDLNNSDVWQDDIVTQLEALDVFYPAEDHHQNYFINFPYHGYCQRVINPKLQKFSEKFATLIKS